MREVADEIKWDIRELRGRLWWLHGMNGERLLFRESTAQNAKIWVDRDELARVWPTRFGPGARGMSEDDRVRVAEELVKQALQELADLRRDHAREQAALRVDAARRFQSGHESRKK